MKKQDNRFSIRKSVYGAVSVVVATCFFVIGAPQVQAEETVQADALSQHVQVENISQQDQTQQIQEQVASPVIENKAPIDHKQLDHIDEKGTMEESPFEEQQIQKNIEKTTQHNHVALIEENKQTSDKNVQQSDSEVVPSPESKEKQSAVDHQSEPIPTPVDDSADIHKEIQVKNTVTDVPRLEEKDQEKVASLDAVKTSEAKENTKQIDQARVLRKAETAVQTANPEQPQNQHPFVFVHGFMGLVGDVAPKGMNYWGGTKANLQEYLRNKGYETYEASVSALASNHERIVDLYHYIVGGRADYGAAHAEKYGHERYGKTYKGILPNWQPGQPIHLVGHSMGGQTIRLLEHYLRNGNQDEIAYQQQHGGTLSPLYQGGHENMITSITTIATPHNGTHAADQLGNTPFIRHLLYGFTRTFGNHLGDLDLGMYHWGFKQREGESLVDYGKRVAKSNLWDSEDTALYDLTTTGAEKLNQQTTVNPDIYYKTFNGQATHKTLSGKHMIDFGMAFAHVLTGNLIGSVKDDIWRPNDGLVSVVSAQHPTGEAHVDVTATSPIRKGIWQVMPTMLGWDHSDFTGNDAIDTKHTTKQLTDFYDEITTYLMRIEAEESKAQTA
ncbi:MULTISPECIES: YSIRK-type signal peptide-containing protein [unclassified Staphylococcus]|uniref:YSIRK-targeted triacylglycerol lipase n=3 Tax=Staphylococcus TaxID=1279 RepID=UPI0021CFC57B|nr:MULTISPECIES: YSIRK-type signal peptide-containing protein [unclassified Staphylococcus]UXR69466.1 YSIRK-type signal peptide-containing protein [Staphylococcus sp. IVB6246]UXR71521.1 YSIRK-type signal peptide-containing protein [Staphylococcus sp. IVB6240]UXR76118.1 YSIRK-type signal peptide-containing protein [Staphylococcus sp. IVB6233]UXR80315.1 YSIRK-type signal peptide-containing protein [Staphylococcus sp. IVB6218]